jgi:AAA domain
VVVCLTNHALDNFLGELKEAGVEKLLRIGSGSKEDWTDDINLRPKSSKTRTTDNEISDLWRLRTSRSNVFTEINEWCQAFSAKALTGRTSWYTVKGVMERDHPEMFDQFKGIGDTALLRTMVFRYWADGGDLGNNCQFQSLFKFLPNAHSGTAQGDQQPSPKDVFNEFCGAVGQQHAAAGAQSIWRIPPVERQTYIDSWVGEVDAEQLSEELAIKFDSHQHYIKAQRKIKRQRDLRVMLQHNVIGVTTTACASQWELINAVEPEIVICEEVGEVMESHSLCALWPSIKHVIFIGDPLQLRPEVQQRIMSLESTSEYRLDESLFERLINPRDLASDALATEYLTVQRRMHPSIADITERSQVN